MEMKGLQPVMAKDGVEEVGEGRKQACDDGVREERVESAPLSLRHGRASPDFGLPLLIALPRCQQARGGEILLRDGGRVQGWLIPGWRRINLGLPGHHWSLKGKE